MRWLAIVMLGVVGCAAPAVSVDEEAVLIDEGKGDDYYSDVADEYAVTGKVGVGLDAATYADEELRRAAIDRRLAAVSLYLTAYLAQKLYGVDLDGNGVIDPSERVLSDDENLGYGGFSAMVRNETITQKTLSGTPPAEGKTATMRAAFRVVVAGPRDLAKRLPRSSGAVSSSRTKFLLSLPAGASFDPGDLEGDEVRRFDPVKAAAAGVALETIELSLARISEPDDAWPRYDAFVADGIYDLTLAYGYDPNPKRYDLVEAHKAYDGLLRMGFTAPAGVDRFEALKPDSGPFVRTAKADEKTMRIEVRVLHSDEWAGSDEGHTARREAQRAQILAELATRDVFFYNGHAGPYEGMTLDPDGIAYVSSNDLQSLELDAHRQQLVVAQGCQSDSQYADALYATDAKDASNLDVVTTINYAYGEGTMALVDGLVHTDGDRHQPRSFYQLIAALNADPINHARDVYYGVIGLGDNPALHPYANVAAIGTSCTANAQCGDPDGNWCVRKSTGGRACAAIALGRRGCPTGTRYRQVAQGNKIVAAVCAQ